MAYLVVPRSFLLYPLPSRICLFPPRKLPSPVHFSFSLFGEGCQAAFRPRPPGPAWERQGQKRKRGGRRWQGGRSGLGPSESALFPKRGRHLSMGPVSSGLRLSAAGPVGPMLVMFRVPPPSVQDAVWDSYGPRDGLGARLSPQGPRRTSGLTSAELGPSLGATWRRAKDQPTSA